MPKGYVSFGIARGELKSCGGIGGTLAIKPKKRGPRRRE